MSDTPPRLTLNHLKGFLRNQYSATELQNLVGQYDSSRGDWREYAHCRPEKAYARNLVERQEHCEIMVLCWNPKNGSPIHSHSKSHCIMKVLEGQITEERFQKPTEGIQGPLQKTSSNTYDTLCPSMYISDDIAIHRITNNEDQLAVTLHVYIPPITECQIFDEKTGASQKVNPKYDTTPESMEQCQDGKGADCCRSYKK